MQHAFAPSLDELAQRFEHLRRDKTPLTEVFRGCLERLGYTPAELDEWEGLSSTEVQNTSTQVRLYRTGLQIAVEAEKGILPTYHNRDHTGETLLAGEALILAMYTDPLDVKLQGLRLLNAMMGHDTGHPGSAPAAFPIGTLERTSAGIAHDCMAAYDSREKSVERDVMMKIIEGTEFCNGPSTNWANHQAFPDRTLFALQVLANDADILASVIPHTGMARGQLLADEWQRVGEPAGDTIGTWHGRLAFLRAVRLRSAGAHALGIPSLHDAEVAVLERMDLYALQAKPMDKAIQEVLIAALAEQASPTPRTAVPVATDSTKPRRKKI